MNLLVAQDQGIAPWSNPIEELSTDRVKVFADKYPVSIGHLLFVPSFDDIGHILSCFEQAYIHGNSLVKKGYCEAFNVGLNQGKAAGQTVMWPHVHLIPRRSYDSEDPVGGVRRVIDGQGNYHVSGYINPLTGLSSDLANGTVLPEFVDFYEDHMVPDMEPGTYPGLVSDRDLDVIDEIVKSLPGHEPIVEIGLFLGKSTVQMAKSSNDSRRIFSVDYCQMPAKLLLKKIDKAGIVVSDAVRNAESQLEMAMELMKDYKSIRVIKSTFNQNFVWDLGDVSLAFEDSDHRVQTMENFFGYWWPKLIPGGVLAGHDYDMLAVKAVVNKNAEMLGLDVQTFTNSNIWAIRKPN